ncbi:ester cyclase [Pendulispora brunnea]|uniref:Ester cyclase n=1 Tax=Pendulispora brunnea TaxID=2905690 RepID=A0ABZ2KFQ1_9BACT
MRATTPNGLAAGDLQIVQTFYRAFSDKKPELLDEAVTPDWEDIPLAPGQGPGPDGLKPILQSIVAAFPDLRIHVEDVIGSHGRIGVRAKITGTHRGEFFGIAATNRPISVALHEFHEMDNGRIKRTWHLEDWFGMLLQIGAWPPARSLHPESA